MLPGGPIIPTSRETIASHLKATRYRTGFVGKWHLGLGWHKLPNGEVRKPTNPEAYKNKGTKGWNIDYSKKVDGGPNALGFDESFYVAASLDVPPYVYLRNDKPTGIPTMVKAFHRPGPATKEFEATYGLIDFARESRYFIKNNASSDNPFFLYLALTSPHTPIVPSEKWQGQSELGSYGDFLMETDWVVGEVLEQLKESGLDENTLIVFTSDNGCSPAANIPDLHAKGHFPNGPWRGHKADIFEGGHRVPFLVRWPGTVKAGSTSDTLVSTVDFFKTVSEIIGTNDTIKHNTAEDSFSFLPILKGQQKVVRPFLIHHSINGQFAIRRGDWKLILCPGSGGWSAPRPKDAIKDESLPAVQLYNLKKDIKESHNLQANHPEIVRSLVTELYQAIKKGRKTSGKNQSNEGWPNTVNSKTLKQFPELASDG